MEKEKRKCEEGYEDYFFLIRKEVALSSFPKKWKKNHDDHDADNEHDKAE